MNLALSPRQRTFFPRPVLASPRLTIRGIGVGDVLPPCTIDRPRGTGDWLILCAQDALELGPVGPAMAAGSLVLWAPGQRQFYRNRRGLRHSWIHLSGSTVAELVARADLPTATACAPGAGPWTRRTLTALQAELGEPHPDEDLAVALLTAWMLALARLQRGARPPAIPEPYASIKREIEEGFARRLYLEHLARRVGVSVQHFGRTFRALVGESPIAYQLRLRLEHAAWLLRDVERSVASVAVEVGCGDQYQFSRAFSKRFGCSPRAWRERLG
jgi:AraC-like DNA-binding protein